MTATDRSWQVVDPWWDSYVTDQERELADLQALLEALDGLWDRSDCIFDEDPLADDWSERTPQAGPLRTNQEENWSQWLAHLLRDSAGVFTAELFGAQFEAAPTHVRCERAFHDEELHDRRVDVLAEFADRGLSIEVKIGDDHYEKTPQTAYLTETHHERELDWTHSLLLPRAKRGALEDAFGDRLTDPESDRPTITASGPHELDVAVVYWRDVARALRRTLLEAIEPGTHWTASAYLFVTLIEQQILQFYAAPSVDAFGAASLGLSDVERLQAIEPDEQLTYLSTLLEGSTDG